jgi:hypothetical protein
MHRIGIGVSTNRDADQAGRAAAKAALKKLGSNECDFALVYATATYDPRTLLAAIRQTVGAAVLCGSSAAGVAVPAAKRGPSTHEVAVLCWTSDQLRFHSTIVRGARAAPAEAVRAALQNMPAATSAVFVFADGLRLDPRQVAIGLSEHLPPEVQVLGAFSADNGKLGQSFQFANTDIADDGLCLVLLEGECEIEQRRASACLLVGQPLEVSRANGFSVLELSGRPAATVLREFTGDALTDGEGRAELALALAASSNEAPELVAIRSEQGAGGAVELSAALDSGTRVFPALIDPRRLASELETATLALVGDSEQHAPLVLLHFESSRLGRLGEAERLGVARQLPGGSGGEVPWLGHYGRGELGGKGKGITTSTFTVTVASIR